MRPTQCTVPAMPRLDELIKTFHLKFPFHLVFNPKFNDCFRAMVQTQTTL